MPHQARCSPSVAAAFLLSILVSSLAAQSPDERATIAKLRDSLAATGEVAALQRLTGRVPTRGGGPIGRLRLGVIHHRLGELTGRREYLDHAMREFAEVARSLPHWAEGWYGMALAKLELYDQGFAAKE